MFWHPGGSSSTSFCVHFCDVCLFWKRYRTGYFCWFLRREESQATIPEQQGPKEVVTNGSGPKAQKGQKIQQRFGKHVICRQIAPGVTFLWIVLCFFMVGSTSCSNAILPCGLMKRFNDSFLLHISRLFDFFLPFWFFPKLLCFLNLPVFHFRQGVPKLYQHELWNGLFLIWQQKIPLKVLDLQSRQTHREHFNFSLVLLKNAIKVMVNLGTQRTVAFWTAIGR